MLSNQIVNASALDLLRGLDSNTVAAVITDPPFFVGIGRGEHEGGFGSDPWSEISTLEETVKWTLPHAVEVKRVLRAGGGCVVMGGSQSLAAWELAAAKVGLSWMAELVVLWNTGKPRARSFGSLSTSIRWYVKPGARHAFNAANEARSIYSNVIVCRKVPLEKREHPAQKPVELTNFLVTLLTDEQDLVVDPFCGAGTTMVSAAATNRRWVGGDTDENAVQVATRRSRHPEFEDTNPLYLWINNRLIPVEA